MAGLEDVYGQLHMMNAKIERMKYVCVGIESATDDVKTALGDILDKQCEQLRHAERKLEWIGSKIAEIELRQCKLSIMDYDVIRFMHTELSNWRLQHDETYIKRKFDEYAHMLYISRLSQGHLA